MWSAANASVTAGPVGIDLDMTAALALAREAGASGWPVVELLAAVRAGLAEGTAKRRAAITGNTSED